MKEYEKRVVEEQVELDKRLAKLENFKAGDIFPTLPQNERDRLILQAEIMKEYSSILDQRIAAFSVNSKKRRYEMALGVLKDLEWSLKLFENSFCPICGREKELGHTIDCRLSNVIYYDEE